MSAGRDRTTLEKAPERAAARAVPTVHRDDVTPVAVPGLATGIQRRSVGDDPLGGTTVAPEIGTALRRRQGGGRPLEPEHAERMGAAMGADLGGVRIHDDGEADTIARSVQATAFTAGLGRVLHARHVRARGRPAATTCWPTSSPTSSRAAAEAARRRGPSSAPPTTPPRPPRTPWPTAPCAGCSARPPGSPRCRPSSRPSRRDRARRSPRCAGRPSGPGPCGGGTRSRRCSVATRRRRPRSWRRRRPCRPR